MQEGQSSGERQRDLYQLAEAQGGYFTSKQPLPLTIGATNGPVTSKLATASVSIAESTGLLSSRNPRARTLFYGGSGREIGATGRSVSLAITPLSIFMNSLM
jgi:hypothetical protein